MILLNRLIRVMLSVNLVVGTWPASAQSLDRITEVQGSLRKQQEEIEGLQSAMTEMKAENGLLKEMLKTIIATQRVAIIYSAIPPEQRKEQLKPPNWCSSAAINRSGLPFMFKIPFERRMSCPRARSSALIHVLKLLMSIAPSCLSATLVIASSC